MGDERLTRENGIAAHGCMHVITLWSDGLA